MLYGYTCSFKVLGLLGDTVPLISVYRKVHLPWCARVCTTQDRLWRQGQLHPPPFVLSLPLLFLLSLRGSPLSPFPSFLSHTQQPPSFSTHLTTSSPNPSTSFSPLSSACYIFLLPSSLFQHPPPSFTHIPSFQVLAPAFQFSLPLPSSPSHFPVLPPASTLLYLLSVSSPGVVALCWLGSRVNSKLLQITFQSFSVLFPKVRMLHFSNNLIPTITSFQQ